MTGRDIYCMNGQKGLDMWHHEQVRGLRLG
jgi:hypothetical protein